MKKILFLGFVLAAIMSISASAQVSDGSRFRHHREMQAWHRGELNRFEKRRLRHDEFRYRTARRRVHRDGFEGRHERRHLAMMRMHDRRELYRFSHNNRRRLI